MTSRAKRLKKPGKEEGRYRVQSFLAKLHSCLPVSNQERHPNRSESVFEASAYGVRCLLRIADSDPEARVPPLHVGAWR